MERSPTTDAPLRLVVIDDHALFAQGLELLLPALRGAPLEVVGWTDQARMALDLVRRHEPDIALVDIDMPPPGGLAAMREIARFRPNIRVVALTGVSDLRLPVRALRHGAHAYLPKTSEPAELIAPLQAIAAGWCVVPPALVEYLGRVAERADNEVVDALDEEDLTLWRLMATGAGTAEAAEHLNVSERTIKRQTASLLRRLGVSNRVAAAALAGQLGVLDDLDPGHRSR